ASDHSRHQDYCRPDLRIVVSAVSNCRRLGCLGKRHRADGLDGCDGSLCVFRALHRTSLDNGRLQALVVGYCKHLTPHRGRNARNQVREIALYFMGSQTALPLPKGEEQALLRSISSRRKLEVQLTPAVRGQMFAL